LTLDAPILDFRFVIISTVKFVHIFLKIKAKRPAPSSEGKFLKNILEANTSDKSRNTETKITAEFPLVDPYFRNYFTFKILLAVI
jgi:hypothetical protein